MLVDTLLPEWDHETGRTRRLLERVPDAQLSWAPHPRSMTLGRLAGHIAELPHWMAITLERPAFDLAELGERTGAVAGSRDEALASFDASVAAARRALTARTDAELQALWTLRQGDHEIFTQPRIGVLRTMIFNHLIHHRGQLSVYLRLLDVAIPSIYGPSADERP